MEQYALKIEGGSPPFFKQGSGKTGLLFSGGYWAKLQLGHLSPVDGDHVSGLV